MNKRIVIGLIILGVVVIGGGLFFALTGTKSDSKQSSNPVNSAEGDKKDSQKAVGSIKTLIGENANRECTFSFADDNGTVNGTAYFANKKQARLNYTHSKDGATTSGSMIITEDSQTFWDNNTKKGFLYKVSASDAPQQSQGLDTGKDINFDCKNWTVDASYFTTPGDVMVTDLSSFTVPSQP